MDDFGVSGLGGIFFKCNNPEETMSWYEQMLGLKTDGEYGATFEWRSLRNPSEKRSTSWSPFPKTSTYFSPSEKPFMVNFRVKDLEKLLEHLQKKGVNLAGEPQLTEYGKFAWILDPDGIKIELWEADDDVFQAITEGKTHPT